MRNGGRYSDPTPAQAFKRMHKTGVLREAKLEEMDSLRPRTLTLDNISEADEQKAVMTWAKYNERQFPALRWLHHIPNGGSRHPAEAVTLKRMGVKAGVPDLCLPYPAHGFHGLYIEMKSEKGYASPLQKEWLEALNRSGYKAVVCRGAQSAINELEGYLKEGAGMSYEELVKALRETSMDFGELDGVSVMLLDAAAAIEALDRLLDQNAQRCEALRKQLREAHESYERHLNELEQQLPKRGEWIYSGEQDDGHNYYCHCSVCGAGDIHAIKGTVPYCWRCGAKMEVQDGKRCD